MATNAPVDVKELNGSYIFVVDVPGLRSTDIKVQIENDTILKISGERRRESGEDCQIQNVKVGDQVKYVRVERPAGRFMRKFNLPNHVNLDAISAACQQGVLTVLVPKMPVPEPHKPRTFEIPVGTTPSSSAI